MNSSVSMRSMHLLRLSLPLVLGAMICWLSLTSSPPSLPGPLGWDKLLHAFAYFLLTISVAQYILMYRLGFWPAGVLAAVMATGYGGLLEIAQLTLQSGRTAEWWDLIADFVGAIAGCVVFCRAGMFLLSKQGDSSHG